MSTPAATDDQAHVLRSERSHLSSFSVSTRYSLSEEDDRPVFAYDWRGRTSLTTQKDLIRQIDESTAEPLRVTKKPIRRFKSTIDVKRHDLYLDSERQACKDFPNYDSSLASITLPPKVILGRALSSGAFDQLFIISPEHSPYASLANSVDGSGPRLSG